MSVSTCVFAYSAVYGSHLSRLHNVVLLKLLSTRRVKVNGATGIVGNDNSTPPHIRRITSEQEDFPHVPFFCTHSRQVKHVSAYTKRTVPHIIMQNQYILNNFSLAGLYEANRCISKSIQLIFVHVHILWYIPRRPLCPRTHADVIC